MISPICYPSFSQYSFMCSFCQPIVANISPAMTWIAFGKIPENPVITPNTTVQVVRPSSINRYLQTVTVNAVAANTTA
jgi:hypothetical protein